MSVIFRHNISSIMLIILVVILISCPLIQTDEDVVIYSSVLNDSFRDATAIGTYADGTILFKVKGHHEYSLQLIHPNGNLDLINNIKICKPISSSCRYELLNPNYVIISEGGSAVDTIIDWEGNKILKNIRYKLKSISQN